MKTPLIVLFSAIVLALSASLFTIVSMKTTFNEIQMDYLTSRQELTLIKTQSDTLVIVNNVLLSRTDSLTELRRTIDSLDARLQEMELRNSYPGYYLTIDTNQNRFHLRWGNLLVRTGYCGTGKGWTTNENGSVWDFNTPLGIRYIEKKGENPYWYRPNWFWLEQDLVPPRPEEIVIIPESLSYEDQIVYYRDSLTAGERIWVKAVPGALGSYKLDLGGGVLLHYGVGRGRNVSHGCIRLSSDDLEAIYRALPLGAPVVIY